jgi:medium-chain acyl-[acyl-carrier-protein] hydrolase
MTVRNQWIWRPEPRPQAAVRLFCVPHAGAGASVYRSWAGRVPASIEVCSLQLPGREWRIAEPPFTSLQPLAEAAAAAIRPELDRPFAFFGHSMGALVAFGVTVELRRSGDPEPRHLFLSACAAPHLPANPLTAAMETMPDDEFREELRSIGELPRDREIDEELWELLLPALRADFAVCASGRFSPEPPLPCGISAFASPDDPLASPAEAEAWRAHTGGPFRLRTIEGDHLYVNTASDLLIEAITEDLGCQVPSNP